MLVVQCTIFLLAYGLIYKRIVSISKQGSSPHLQKGLTHGPVSFMKQPYILNGLICKTPKSVTRVDPVI